MLHSKPYSLLFLSASLFVGSISSFAQNRKIEILEENPKPGKMINYDGSVSIKHQKHPNCTCIVDTLELELPDGSFEMRLLTTNHNILVSEKLYDSDGSSTMAEVFENAEVMPKYKSGRNDLVKHIKQEMKMGMQKYDSPIEIQFVVLKNGTITNVKVDKKFQKAMPVMETKLISILKNMPAWTAGKVKGNPVNAFYSMNLFLNQYTPE